MKRNSLLLILLLLQVLVYGRNTDKARLQAQPLSFLENKGQIRDQKGNVRTDIDFIMHSGDMTLYIGEGTLHYQFIKQQESNNTGYSRENLPKQYQAGAGVSMARIDVVLEGANKAAALVKEVLQEVKHHYYTDGSPEGTTGVSAYRKITYKNVYPNIDWVLYTDGSGLKYDFIVHPGGKVADIRLQYEGAQALQLEKDGSLKVQGYLGRITEAAPYIYEQASKKVVDGKFILAKNKLSYQTSAYEGTLVIDPGVEWATYFGGSEGESAQGVATDQNEYIYISGLTSSLANIATTGAHQATFSGASVDGYLAKFDSLGELQWATYYGGPATGFFQVTQGLDVACDRFGNVFMSGITTANSGIATPGSHQQAKSTNSFMNSYLAKFNNEGIRQWGTYYGGSITTVALFANSTQGQALACDLLGNVYIGGNTDSLSALDPDFATAGAHQTTYGGGMSDAWLVKFDSSGNRQWATLFGSAGMDGLTAIVCDDSNQVYIAGYTNSEDAIATSGTLEDTYGPESGGGFVAKFTESGVQEWGSYLRGGWSGVALALDDFDHLYVGSTSQGNMADTFVYTLGCHLSILQENSQYNGFLIQFNKRNGLRSWGTYYGAENPTFINGVATDALGNVFITGYTTSYAVLTTETIATSGSHQDTLGGPSGLTPPEPDAFLVQFDSSGVRKWASYFGGAEHDVANGIVASSAGAIYIVGETASTTAVATPGAYQTSNAGTTDGFLVRWLPVDISLHAIVSPENDTLCSGDVPLSVWVKNQGRMDKTDDLVISYTYAGPDEGSAEFSFPGGLAVGEEDTFSLGNLSMPFPGDYELTVYLHYTRDDNDRNNDTIHMTLTATNAAPEANIEVSQVGTVFHFSNPSAQPSDSYLWDFGDGETSTEINPSHEYAVTDEYEVTLIVTGFCGSDTATIMVEGIGGNGIDDPTIAAGISIYPNPVHQILYLKAETLLQLESYSIVNVLGQEVQGGQLKGQNSVDVNGLAAGSYFIRIKTNKGVINKQFQMLDR